MSKHYKIIIPIDSDACDAHRLQDNKVFASLASDISNRLWHLGCESKVPHIRSSNSMSPLSPSPASPHAINHYADRARFLVLALALTPDAPTGKVVVTYTGNEVIIPTMHPLNDDVKQWALEQCEQLYDPHPCGPARREECDGEC